MSFCAIYSRVYMGRSRRFQRFFTGEMGYFEDIQKTVRQIPRGKVATYGGVARAAGHPGTARQVAWALRAPGSKRIPWHRVVGRAGRILLPGEAGLYQRTLLELEGVPFKRNHVDIDQSELNFFDRPRPLKNLR